MVSDRELMEIHVEALFTSEVNGRLRGINDPGGDPGPAPRFFFGEPGKVRYADSDMTFLRMWLLP